MDFRLPKPADPCTNPRSRPMTSLEPAAVTTSQQDNSLLPAGLRDVLPPEADYAADVVERLRACFAGHGYLQVKPPLIEFEASLLDGAGIDMSSETFRLMDPVSQDMMGVRADITPQIARIATTRLTNAPRPLRLTYAGDVLRVRGTQLRPERQFAQIGAELIGAATAAADVEVVLLAIDALRDLGLDDLSTDLSTPSLVSIVCKALNITGNSEARLRAALNRKDAGGVADAAAAAGADSRLFSGLLGATGPAAKALDALGKLDLPKEARDEQTRLSEVCEAVSAALPDLDLTIDPVENRGFEYHTGVSFTFFKRGVRGELGSGGRYLAGDGIDGRGTEPATGFTLYLDTILRALPGPAKRDVLYLPFGTNFEDGAQLRREGWTTVAAIENPGRSDKAITQDARRLDCTHMLSDGAVVPLKKPKGR